MKSSSQKMEMTTLTSIWMWAASTILLTVWYPAVLLRSLFDRSPGRLATGRLFRDLGVLLTKLNPLWKITVIGTEAARNSRTPHVVVSNHQSLADIPVLSHLPWEMKWMAKKELFSLPFIGWQLKLAGDIPVERDNPRSAVKTLRKARAVLEQKCSVMVFAEGSRSPDGNMGPFLDGAFRLAIDAGVPILPVVVEGTFNCLPKKSWKFGKARQIRVEVLEAISTKGLSRVNVAQLRDLVRARIAGRLEEMRRSPAENVLPPTAEREDSTSRTRSEELAFGYNYESFFD
jgi:1-acyl-sn-glycerol-3-phosphate acyltransferase